MDFDAYFVRHGESAGNIGLATDDPATIPLTEKGRCQADAVAASVSFVPTVIVSSPFLRARDTAESFHNRFPSAGRISLPIQEFTYLNPSAWRGTTGEQRRGAAESYWQCGDADYCDGEGAESFTAFFARIEACLAWLRLQPGKPVILVSHEMFIRGVVWRCLLPDALHATANMQAFRAWLLVASLPNASVTRITCSESGSVAVVSPFTL